MKILTSCKKWYNLIKIGQEITKLLLFEGFNVTDIGTAIFEYLMTFVNFKILCYFYNQSICS